LLGRYDNRCAGSGGQPRFDNVVAAASAVIADD